MVQRRQRVAAEAILGAIIALLLLASFSAQGVAQTCRTDNECRNSFTDRPRCIGNTLVTKRSYCSGVCRIEERRQDCGRVAATRCLGGGAFERIIGRCDALGGRCTQRRERKVCLRSCSCRGNVMVIYTGACSSAIGCHQGIVRCKSGCSCKPTPHCLGGRKNRLSP